MKYKIRHTTAYQYDESVTHCYNLGYILPRETDNQQVLDTKITLTPKANEADVRLDYFKNRFYHFSIEVPHDHLDVTVHSQLEMIRGPTIPIEFPVTCQQARECLAKAPDDKDLMAREFILESPFIKFSEDIVTFAQSSFDDQRPLLESVLELTERIFTEFTYDPGFSNLSTPLRAVVEHKRGVCQDFAHLAIACLRALGFPARYVSGYLETVPPPGQQKLVGADATHAWFSAYIPELGWVDFDPTNNTIISSQHITTAWGRDYSDVPPLKGIVFGGGDSSVLSVEVDVNPEHPDAEEETSTGTTNDNQETAENTAQNTDNTLSTTQQPASNQPPDFDD